MIPKLVSVIVATHNNKACLVKCLESVRAQNYAFVETIVLLNACNDGSREFVAAELPEAVTIINEENLYFAQAQNQGIALARGEFVLCLNDDCVLEKKYISEALKAFSLGPLIGMATGKVLRCDGLAIDTTGMFLGLARKPVERGFARPDRGQYAGPSYVFGVCAAAGLYRKQMLEEVRDPHGYFDRRFGMFYEDLDLAWRANRKGWKGYYLPQAIAYHARGSSIPKERAFFGRRFYFAGLPAKWQRRLIRNRHLTIAKNESLSGFFLHAPWIIAYEAVLWAGYFLGCFCKTGSSILFKKNT